MGAAGRLGECLLGPAFPWRVGNVTGSSGDGYWSYLPDPPVSLTSLAMENSFFPIAQSPEVLPLAEGQPTWQSAGDLGQAAGPQPWPSPTQDLASGRG